MYKIEKGKLTIGLPGKAPVCGVELVDGNLEFSINRGATFALSDRNWGRAIYNDLVWQLKQEDLDHERLLAAYQIDADFLRDIVEGSIRSICDPQTYTLTKLVYGSKANSGDYNLVREKAEILSHLVEMGCLIPVMAYLKTADVEALSNLAQPREVIDATKGTLRRHEWRTYLNLSPDWLPTRRGTAFGDYQMLMKVLTRMEPKPPKRVWSSILSIQQDMSRHYGDFDKGVELLLLVGRELNGNDPMALRFLKQDNTVILDWIQYNNDLTVDQLKAMTFRTAHLRATRWHQEHRRGRYSWATNNNNYEWISLIDDIIIDKWRVEALNSSGALREEGRVMDHCVATYDAKCERGDSRIFSVQNSEGVHTGTLELTTDGANKWVKRQLHGPQNAPVPAKAVEIANQFTQLYNEAT